MILNISHPPPHYPKLKSFFVENRPLHNSKIETVASEVSSLHLRKAGRFIGTIGRWSDVSHNSFDMCLPV